jgi:glycerophosphoryl diester phosphodiesterase
LSSKYQAENFPIFDQQHQNDIIYVNDSDRIFGGSGELPSDANTILDFQIGVDMISIVGAMELGISAETLSLNEVNGNTEISFADQTLAILNGVTSFDVNVISLN